MLKANNAKNKKNF